MFFKHLVFVFPFLLTGCLPAVISPLVDSIISTGTSIGVSATEERGLKGTVEDTKTKLAIEHLWFRKNHSITKSVELTVYNNRVLLTGTLPCIDDMADAVALAWQPEGVEEVINEIRIDVKRDLIKSSKDKLIETELASAILFDKRISSINYRIVAFDRTLYLIGTAYDQIELNHVIAHARKQQYVRKIINHVRLRELKEEPEEKAETASE